MLSIGIATKYDSSPGEDFPHITEWQNPVVEDYKKKIGGRLATFPDTTFEEEVITQEGIRVQHHKMTIPPPKYPAVRHDVVDGVEALLDLIAANPLYIVVSVEGTDIPVAYEGYGINEPFSEERFLALRTAYRAQCGTAENKAHWAAASNSWYAEPPKGVASPSEFHLFVKRFVS